MPKKRTLKIVAGIAASFIGFVGIIIYLSANKIVSFTVAGLMIITLLGLYFGFGVLFVVYRLTNKME